MKTLVPVYVRRPSALHSARAGVGALYALSFPAAALLLDSPLALAVLLLAILLAGAAAGVGAQLRRALWVALPLGLLITAINPLVSSEGNTLLLRGGSFLGHRFDFTLEALTFGAVSGMRFVTIVVGSALLSAAVDPDELLRALRRISPRSALTATLATRLVPVLARDAARMSDAARCRPQPPGRALAVRAVLSNSLERAVEVAAALEVRGYGAAVRPARRERSWSRHDVTVLAAACSVVLVAFAGKLTGAGAFDAYPRLELAAGVPELVLCAGLLAAALLPFAGRSARMGVGG